MMRYRCVAAAWLGAALAGMAPAARAQPAEAPPFATSDTPERAALQARFEDLDQLRNRLAPQQVEASYRTLYHDVLRAYGRDVYEPYAVLDRLVGYYDGRSQVSETDFARQAQPAEAARAALQRSREIRRQLLADLGRSKVVDWRKRGETAKHEGLIHLSEGRVAEARAALDEAAQLLSAHPVAGGYSLARVLLAQAELAVSGRRWDDAEALCDRLFRLFHAMNAVSTDQLTLDVLDGADQYAAYHLAYTLARRRADEPGKASRYAEWNLNTKVHRREVFARRLAALKAAGDGPAAEVWGRLRSAWSTLAGLALRPAGPGATRAMQVAHTGAIRAALVEVKALAREAARVAPAVANEWVTIDQVRAALPPDAVLIDLVSHLEADLGTPAGVTRWTGARDVAFVIPPAGRGEVRMVDLGDEEPLFQAMDRFVRTFAPPEADTPAARRAGEAESLRVGRDLSRLLLDPLLPHVGAYGRWIISPYALTWQVPWSTLTDGDGRLVVERHATSYILAGRHVVRTPATPGAGADAPAPAPLILAAPEYGPSPSGREEDAPFRPLPETEAEARAIAPNLEAFAGAAPRLLLGAAAAESALYQAPSPRVLVASTHGYYGGLADALLAVNSPMLRCGLALAGANARRLAPLAAPGLDGVATGLEILGGDFRGTDLVVLSACETSYGEFQTSQGLIGLNLAFHLAGARTVLGALWPVPVDETTELTTAFFAELARGTTGDEALRRAQAGLVERLRTKAGGAPPWIWAGFLLSGDALPGRAPAAPK
jgi:hypothetical protein